MSEEPFIYDIQQAKLTAAVEALEYNLVAILKPSVMIDGNRWCVLYGENLAEGIAGFRDTPYEAVLAFNKEWNRQIAANEALGGE